KRNIFRFIVFIHLSISQFVRITDVMRGAVRFKRFYRAAIPDGIIAGRVSVMHKTIPVNRHLAEMQSSVENSVSPPSPASRRDAAFVRITDVMRGVVRSNVSTELQSRTGLLPAGYL
ncbi:MAG: hypothetical protein LBG45_07220, partial [Dysgonamonadaceae bacterium]|nr:hypothetical protein [Dysgonamonadaceae bacterium]